MILMTILRISLTNLLLSKWTEKSIVKNVIVFSAVQRKKLKF